MSRGPLATQVLGSRPVERMWRATRPAGLRVLAYHDVVDGEAFRSQLRHVVEHYTPVTADQVVAAVADGRPLVQRAVWITFDDGYPAVVRTAQPILDELGVHASMFICPDLVGTSTPFWWDVVRAAVTAGLPVPVAGQQLQGATAITALKRLPDRVRREVVDALTATLTDAGTPVRGDQLSETEIDAWVAAGHHVDNHTLDHPCLDTCTAEEQVRQVKQAHEWLVHRWPTAGRIFAYPNGSEASPAREALIRLGYRAAVLFDHRVARTDGDSLALSRLRIDTDAPLPRFRAIVSGAHPTAFHVARRMLGRRRS